MQRQSLGERRLLDAGRLSDFAGQRRFPVKDLPCVAICRAMP